MIRSASTLMTAEEFAEQYMDVPGVELVRGEVITLYPGGMEHGGSSANACGLLFVWARESKRGRVFTNETGLITERDPDSIRGVDVAYFSYERLPRDQRPTGFSDMPPELAVEVFGRSKSWKDLVEKAQEYLRMGVDCVRLLDPRDRSLTIYRSESEPQRLTKTDEVRDDELLPGFTCRVAEFFED